jgi:SNF2 family DNA or RNA helicase
MCERLPDLAVLLRPYQMTGVRWLEAAARGCRAGLLADDMGLGKTLQAIALIRLLASGTGVSPVSGDSGILPESPGTGGTPILRWSFARSR